VKWQATQIEKRQLVNRRHYLLLHDWESQGPLQLVEIWLHGERLPTDKCACHAGAADQADFPINDIAEPAATAWLARQEADLFDRIMIVFQIVDAEPLIRESGLDFGQIGQREFRARGPFLFCLTLFDR
jgi:hypothetical protein